MDPLGPTLMVAASGAILAFLYNAYVRKPTNQNLGATVAGTYALPNGAQPQLAEYNGIYNTAQANEKALYVFARNLQQIPAAPVYSEAFNPRPRHQREYSATIDGWVDNPTLEEDKPTGINAL
jgi:hypothetical protein